MSQDANGEMSDFEINVYLRLSAHELLLQQLYVQLASTMNDPTGALTRLETGLIKVCATLKPPASGIEDKHIRLLQVQRDHGPDLIHDFFRKVRRNLPSF